jgi:hypothetical protein
MQNTEVRIPETGQEGEPPGEPQLDLFSAAAQLEFGPTAAARDCADRSPPGPPLYYRSLIPIEIRLEWAL